MNSETAELLQEMVDKSSRIIFFGGAGVSTESGIPDFRSRDGLFCQKHKYSPKRILSKPFYQSKTEEFYDFYREKMLWPDAKPNRAHKKLAELEEAGKLLAVVTQNIDGLHQAAGSRKVLELHGSIHRNHCKRCGKLYSLNDMLHTKGIPMCACGGVIKPDVVLYEEKLDQKVIAEAARYMKEADLLIIGGTSLSVAPASRIIRNFKGPERILINRVTFGMESRARLVIEDSIGDVLDGIKVKPEKTKERPKIYQLEESAKDSRYRDCPAAG